MENRVKQQSLWWLLVFVNLQSLFCMLCWKLGCSSDCFSSHFNSIWLHKQEYVGFYEGHCATCVTMNRWRQLLHLKSDSESMRLLHTLNYLVTMDQGNFVLGCEAHWWQEVEVQQTNSDFNISLLVIRSTTCLLKQLCSVSCGSGEVF